MTHRRGLGQVVEKVARDEEKVGLERIDFLNQLIFPKTNALRKMQVGNLNNAGLSYNRRERGVFNFYVMDFDPIRLDHKDVKKM